MALNFQDVIRDVHNPETHSLHTDGGGATIFAVVNAGGGNVTLNPSGSFIGLATVVGNVGLLGNVTLSDSKGFIGLVTVVQGTSPWSSSLVGNVTLSDSKGYIGLTSVNIGGSLPALSVGAAYIGLVSIQGNVNLNTGANYVGLMSISGSVTASGTINTKTALTVSSPTSTSVGVASAQAVASNSSRKGLILTNTSTNTISLGIGATAVLNNGITLNPSGGTFVMDEYNFTTGAINAIAGGASSNLTIQEFTT